MKMPDNYKSSIPPKHETVLPPLEIGKVIKKYESTGFLDVIDLNEYPKRTLHSHRYKETSLERLDKIDHEILVCNDKLITALHIEPIEFGEFDNKGLKTETFTKNKGNIFSAKLNTPQSIAFPKKKSKCLLSKSVNVSPLRMSKKSQAGSQSTSGKTNAKPYAKDNVRLKNIAKFINKPKSSGKNTKETSRSSSVSNKNKSSNALTTPTKAKRHLISFPSLNARNNDKIIVDLQTMFGKKVENFESINKP